MTRKNDYLWSGPTEADAYEELAAIHARISNVLRFEKTLAFLELETPRRNLHHAQLSAMHLYANLLQCRIDDWEHEL